MTDADALTLDEVPFLVVGAGPTGLTLAALLAQAGRRCLVVERADGPQPNPSAHVINARTLEIFRQADLDMGAIAAISQDPAVAGHVNFVTCLTGELIGRLPFERQGDECLSVTPTPLRNISQHRLEPLLARMLQAIPGVEIRYGTEWVSSTQDAAGVISVLRDVATGEETTVRSGYLLGADGAGSAVRRSLDIEMVGPASIQDFVAIHFLADLSELVAQRPGVLHFVMDPQVGGTLVSHDVEREWVFMCAQDIAETALVDDSPAAAVGLLRRAIGDERVALEVVRVGTWRMSAQVAEHFGRQRTFLVGDAAHRFPPTGGMGLNTGVADAHNLAWKLVAVDDGWAAPALLDTYEAERRPIAETNCHQSVTNAFKMILLADALGLVPGATTADLAAALADPERAEQIRASVAEQATHFDMLGLQLGYCYADGALVRAGDPPAPIEDPGPFAPTGSVGGRLPHGWLDDGRSTLDLIEPGAMSLLTFGDHGRWASAVSAATVPVHQIRVGVDAAVSAEWRAAFGPSVDGALLVRPDQHVAWRSDDDPTGSPDALLDALGSIVG